MTEVEQQPPPQNGIDLSAAEEDDSSKARPADIEQDMREMERRKRVEAIMGSKLFREELERIVDSARDGGGILQQLSDIMGVQTSARVGNVFKATNCMLPINDIRGVESMGYAKGEKILRCKLAATFRLLDLYGWTQGLGAQITARLKVDQENFLVNPYGMMYHEITASSLNRVDMQGQIVEQGTTNFGVNKTHFALHSVVHAARPDIRCAIYIGCTPVVAVSSLKVGLLPITRDACVLGDVTTHTYTGTQMDADERDRLVRALGPNSKVLILSNYGALCCGETIEEAFFAASHIVKACETQLQLLPVGVDNLVLIPEESRKAIYIEARRPPEDLEKKFAAAVATIEATNAEAAGVGADGAAVAAKSNVAGAPKWRVGGAEFEALMRMLDNAGYRTGYIYRHPLIKSDPPKPKNDVELPPAVSSLGYLLEEEELLKQGIWKKGDFRKGGDRSRWLNSPNVYQKVEVLETGTPDPKKITKWVAEGSPTHSTPVRIEDALQFVPAGTNPKEFKRLQQQIKDNRRADKISAGPQSHILEGVTWDEAARIKDATVSSAGDHVVLMGAASKGIIQRGYQHNAAVYKAPYAKNPFDNVTDDELNEYKRTVERKKKSIHGEYTDTDFSESEPLSSMPISAPQQTKQTTITTAAVSQSEPEDVSEHQVMRIQTQQAPIPSQPEVVLSDATLSFINGERSHTAVNRKPPTGRDIEYPEEEEDGDENYANSIKYEMIVDNTNSRQYTGKNQSGNNNQQCMQRILDVHDFETTKQQQQQQLLTNQSNKENIHCGNQNIKRNFELIAELKNDALFQKQKHKLQTPPSLKYELKECTIRQGQCLANRMLRFGVSGDNFIEKCGVGVSDCVEFVVSGSPCNECFAGAADTTTAQEHSTNVETLGFRPIHPIEPHADANETVTQQPQFHYADANNNNDNNNNDECGCQHQQRHRHQQQLQLQHIHAHHHHQHHQHHQQHNHHCCHHMSTANGPVALPNFEQAFGHLLGRPLPESCALYYDNYAPLYDTTQYAADTTRTASINSTAAADIDEADNPYKKSVACCTPAVCDSIFELLRKPSACNDNNLIFNIPFTAETPDTTTTTNTSTTTPRKTRCDFVQKTRTHSANAVGKLGGSGGGGANAHSPYRTLSHFGFNSPQRDPQPDHKHIPCTTEPKKYVPLRKSISYEEIFSSPRYVDLCEYCFEKIVRLKPEIAQQTQTRLRNLCDYNGGGAGGGATACGVGAGARYQGGLCPGIMYQPACTEPNAYDYVEYASSDTTEETLPPFSSQLEPVLEVVEEVEPDSNEDATKKVVPPTSSTHADPQLVARTPSNSSFIEKIMRLNYSEESTDWNFAQAPHKVVSCTNLTLELERAILEENQGEQQVPPISSEQQVETRHYNTEKESECDASNEGALTAYVNAEEEVSDTERRVSITEIWEFMQWQDEVEEDKNTVNQEHADYEDTYSYAQRSSSQGSGGICLYYENATNHKRTRETETDALPQTQDACNSVEREASAKSASPASATTSNDSGTQERRRSLMTREERSRRKLVFQELWEDHISFLDGKELNSLSDTESAIDGQQEESASSARRTLDEETETAGNDDVMSVGREQDVTHELNVGNELLLVHTKEGSIAPSVTVAVDGCQASMEPEVFNSRSIILKNCTSGTTMSTTNDDAYLDTLTKSETLMKLQTTEVRRFSLHDLTSANQSGSESFNRSWASTTTEPKSTTEVAVDEADELQAQTKDTIESSVEVCSSVEMEVTATPTKLSPKISTTVETQTKDSVVEAESAEAAEASDLPTKAQTEKLSRTVTKVVNFAPSRCFVKPKAPDVTQKSTDELLEPKEKDELVVNTAPQTEKFPKTVGVLTRSKSREQSKTIQNNNDQRGTPTSSPSTPNQPKAKTNKPKILNLRSRRSMPNPCVRVETNRPATPKPPTNATKLRKRSTLEPQPTLLEAVLKSRQKHECAANSSESEDNQSARTYDLSASRECMFFREHEMDNAATNAADRRADYEANHISCMTDKCAVGRNGAHTPRENTNTAATKQAKHKAAQDVANILINKLIPPTIERAKAGMVLHAETQKPKTEHNTAPENVTVAARVAQLTTEALREPPSKLYETTRLTTKRAHNKPTRSLNESCSNEASTSIQAAQKRASSQVKLMYEPKVQDYLHFKQNIPLPTSPTSVIVTEDSERDAEDFVNPFETDGDEAQFAELVESDEHEDLTKLSEEFEELLWNVENLQLQAQTREQGGAEARDEFLEGGNASKEVLEEVDDDADSHLNPMERKILRKIRESQLKECEEIFDKIEMTIRNKVTPTQLEQLVREQSLNDGCKSAHEDNETKSSYVTFTASTPERFLSAHTSLADASSTVEQSFAHESATNASEAAVTEPLLQEQNSSSSPSADESSTLTPNGTHNYSRQSIASTSSARGVSTTAAINLRRSRSLTPTHDGKRREHSPPPAKLNKTTTPPQEMRQTLSSTRRDTKGAEVSAYKTKVSGRTISKWPRICSSTPEMKTSKRNFILENIRNAAIPRHSGAVGSAGVVNVGCGIKRLQGNAQAIFCKNPFGPLSASSSCSHMSNSSLTSSTTSTSRTIVKNSSSTTIAHTNRQLSPRNSSTGVYTFQSKLVRGSPRFWVSLTQPNVKKLQTQKRRRRSQQQQYQRLGTNDSTGSLCEYNEFMDKENEAPMELEEQERHEELMAAQTVEQIYVETDEPENQVEHEEVEIVKDYEEGDKECTTNENADAFDLVGAVGTTDGMDVVERQLSHDNDGDCRGGGGVGGVEHELAALGEQIHQLEPLLDKYQNKMCDLDAHVAQCTRHMDDCIAVQADIVENQRELREQMTLQQYAEHIMCQVQTYSISETED